MDIPSVDWMRELTVEYDRFTGKLFIAGGFGLGALAICVSSVALPIALLFGLVALAAAAQGMMILGTSKSTRLRTRKYVNHMAALFDEIEWRTGLEGVKYGFLYSENRHGRLR